MRCFITGVAGFVGSSLADTLLAQGHEVIGIDCFTDYYSREVKERNLDVARSYDRFTFRETNLLELNYPALLDGVQWIFHQAAQAGVRASWGREFSVYTDNNVLATQRLLEGIRESKGQSLTKIIYASSSSIYGNAETLPTREEVAPRPISPYGVTKLAAEHLMMLYASEYQLPTVSLRYFTVYGPRQRPDMAFHRFIKSGLTGGTISIYGDGLQTRDFTYIDDIVAANILAAERAPTGSIYNLGGGSRISLREVLTIIETLLDGRKLNVRFDARQYGDATHTGADTTRARNELHFEPTVKLTSGLAEQAKWLKEELGL